MSGVYGGGGGGVMPGCIEHAGGSAATAALLPAWWWKAIRHNENVLRCRVVAASAWVAWGLIQ